MKRQLFGYLGMFAFLFILAACSIGSSTSTSNTVQVTETEYNITSSQTSFSPGVTYHFVVTNNGKVAHEFMIMPKSEGSMSGMSMSNMDTLAFAAIENINPGETKMLNYAFPTSAANSSPEFACYLPGHYEAGMKLDVKISA